MRASLICPLRTRATISSGQASPPNWSTPASSAFCARSSGLRCSTPQQRASMNTLPLAMCGLIRPQSVQTTPSKPYFSRSRPVITSLLKPKPTSSMRQTDGLAVVGHDLRGAGLEGRLEGTQVIVEVVARVDLLFAVGEVRVLAVLLRPAAGEVLGHAGHAVSGRAPRPGSRGCRLRPCARRARRPRRRCR